LESEKDQVVERIPGLLQGIPHSFFRVNFSHHPASKSHFFCPSIEFVSSDSSTHLLTTISSDNFFGGSVPKMPLTTLPPEIYHRILEFSDLETYHNLASVNRHFEDLVKQQILHEHDMEDEIWARTKLLPPFDPTTKVRERLFYMLWKRAFRRADGLFERAWAAVGGSG
jgi:F-box domain